MAKEVEREKHISVLVEQAFPTCILVSYEEEGKTFRGVLLHESSHTVTRSSVSKVIENNDTSSNLCLTSARSVTCSESNVSPMPQSRIGTRSSTMSQDQGDTPNDVITPVDKVRGLVKKLSPQIRQKAKTKNTFNPMETSPQQKMTLMKSLKRKRTNSSPGISPKLDNLVEKEEGGGFSADSKLSLSPNLSPLISVLNLKLRRTAGTRNNYVAVPTINPGNSKQGEQCYAKSNDQGPGKSQDNSSHRHNTRFKRQKQTNGTSDGLVNEKKPGVQKIDGMLLQNGESLVEVYTKTTNPAPSTMLDDTSKGKVLASKAYAKRGVQPRTHNQEMRVGDIVWGKVHGHPWWPGRILGILCHASENNAGFVKVAWYGSPTTSEISCSFLMTFQENFKHLFKKQKSGAYRRAVREAQQDLQVMSADGQVIPA